MKVTKVSRRKTQRSVLTRARTRTVYDYYFYRASHLVVRRQTRKIKPVHLQGTAATAQSRILLINLQVNVDERRGMKKSLVISYSVLQWNCRMKMVSSIKYS